MLKNRSKKCISAIITVVVLCSMIVSAFAADIVQDRFYSTYTTWFYNVTSYSGAIPNVGTYTDALQYRLNCYGYALRTHFLGSVLVNQYGGYKQQPGDFASLSNKNLVNENVIVGNPTASMNNIVYNMQLDAARIGYSISEYVPTSSYVAQAPSGTRMIALVTGNTDYHYYMQHSNGYWSHKPGSAEVTNVSLQDGVELSNSNIRSKANQGAYSGGALKFFLITKDAVLDYPHGAPSSTAEMALYYKDKAGDSPVTSTNISQGTTSAYIDHFGDRDVYCFTPATSGTYVISTAASNNSNIEGTLSDSEGNRLTYDYSNLQVYFSYYLTAGNKYYITLASMDRIIDYYELYVTKV